MIRRGLVVGVGLLVALVAAMPTLEDQQTSADAAVSFMDVDTAIVVETDVVEADDAASTRPDPNATPEEWENPNNLQWTTQVPKPINVPAYYGQQIVNGAQSVQNAIDNTLKPLAGTGIPLLVHGSGLEGNVGNVATAGTTLGGTATPTPPQQSPLQHMVGDTLQTLAPVVGLVNKPAGAAMEFAGNALSNSASANDRAAAAEARRWTKPSGDDYSRGQVTLQNQLGTTNTFPDPHASSIPSISDSMLSSKPGPSSISGMDQANSLMPKPGDPKWHTPADSTYKPSPIDNFDGVKSSDLTKPSSMTPDIDTSAAGTVKAQAGRQAEDVANAAAAAAKQKVRDNKIKKQASKAGGDAAAAAAAAAIKQKQKGKGAKKGTEPAEEKLETTTSNIKQRVTKALADDDKPKPEKQKKKQKKQQLKEKKKLIKQKQKPKKQKKQAKTKKSTKAKDKTRSKKKAPKKLVKKQPKRSAKKPKVKAKANAKKNIAKKQKKKLQKAKKVKSKPKKPKAKKSKAKKSKAKKPKAKKSKVKRAPKRAKRSRRGAKRRARRSSRGGR